ncbi:NUDIX domain-containing protein [Ditylenchus destructor]|uniref:NUDIX domain-containing protein n=1 Tax=Ditylenchus destructor TaxID=166010 RepID=A0AAD4R2G6_9BILA|nr:NUDIX domain-containing protein [Ditylenchus destructor]
MFLVICSAILCFSFVSSKDDHRKSGSVLVLHQHGGNVYALLVRDRWKRSWTLPGGYAHVGEHRNHTAARELKEETNGALRIDPKDLNFGPGWDKPFHNYIHVPKGRHRNITFVAATKNFAPGELRKIAERMRDAPKRNGYRETNGIAFVNVQQLIYAGMWPQMKNVHSSLSWTFDYKHPKAQLHKKDNGWLKLSRVLKNSLMSHLAEFQDRIARAAWSPPLVHHHYV